MTPFQRDDVFDRLDWQADCERRSLAFDAFDLDRASMQFHQLLHQMEPDAGSRDPGRSAGAEKPLEKPWNITVGYAAYTDKSNELLRTR